MALTSDVTQLTPDAIWKALDAVKDPEIPVVSVVEMGIVRAVENNGTAVTVTMTPTFSGCPALHVMRKDIESCMRDLGFEQVTVEVVLAPAWSTDWIADSARVKLKKFGLAPPPKHGGKQEIIFFEHASCPYCDSANTSLRNGFGPTLCRAIHYCHACQQPFEQFKPL